jgi:uncharacterized membrane protein
VPALLSHLGVIPADSEPAGSWIGGGANSVAVGESAGATAAAFHPALATVGVLLAVLGYVLGTCVGVIDALVLQQIAGLYGG